MREKNSLDEKYLKLKNALEEQQTFTMADVENLFQDLSRPTKYWLISELVRQGYVRRERRGIFKFNEWMGKRNIVISDEAKRLMESVEETGYQFFISGLDVLLKYMQHVPEQYPLMLFVEKIGREETKRILGEMGYLVFEPTEFRNGYETAMFAGRAETMVIMYSTDSFEYEDEGVAILEKAFVDTYYSVTRNSYPLSLQELVRMYENMVRTGNLDPKRTVTIASKRSLQHDIRYIVESRYITDEAMKFVEILRKG